MAGDLDRLRVAIVVTDYFEQVELTSPRDKLEEAGARLSILSNKSGRVRGMNRFEKADWFDVDAVFDDVRVTDFDAVVLPGGVMSADMLRIMPEARVFVKAMAEDGKPFAVIGHAPWLLVSARLVRGRRLASSPTLQDDIRNAGGRWIDDEAFVDGNWVSSRTPQDLPAFSREMVNLFAEHTRRFLWTVHRGEPRELPGGDVYEHLETEPDKTPGSS